MVWTRSRATSPGHQGSRDASSNPNRDRQSAPVMQTSSVQHVQSMAAVMAELTHQNQELRMEINLRRQTRDEREGGGQTQSHDDRENTEIGSQLRGTTSGMVPHLKEDEPKEESHGGNEREHEKGEYDRRFGPQN